MSNVQILNVETTAARCVVDITDLVQANITAQNGLANLFVLHTTAALTTADLDPGGTDQDYLDAFDKLIPRLHFRHPHDPSHMPDHILSSLIGTSLSLPVDNGRLVLGSWQRITLIELNGPRQRQLAFSLQTA